MSEKFLSLIWISILLSACSEHSKPQIPSIPAESQKVAMEEKSVVTKAPAKKVISSYILSKSEAQKKLSAGAALFDTRGYEEFGVSHLPSAINLPFDQLEATLPALEGYKKEEILLIGKDTKQVETMRNGMMKAGFSKVLNAQSLNSKY